VNSTILRFLWQPIFSGYDWFGILAFKTSFLPFFFFVSGSSLANPLRNWNGDSLAPLHDNEFTCSVFDNWHAPSVTASTGPPFHVQVKDFPRWSNSEPYPPPVAAFNSSRIFSLYAQRFPYSVLISCPPARDSSYARSRLRPSLLNHSLSIPPQKVHIFSQSNPTGYPWRFVFPPFCHRIAPAVPSGRAPLISLPPSQVRLPPQEGSAPLHIAFRPFPFTLTSPEAPPPLAAT